jgi:hypothetical protein
MDPWGYIVTYVVGALAILYGILWLDRHEHRITRDLNREYLREQAHEEMERINFLYPPE